MSYSKEKVELLFQQCIELPQEEWEQRLASACGGDEDLKRRVLRLLEAHQSGGGFLDAVPLEERSVLNEPVDRDQRSKPDSKRSRSITWAAILVGGIVTLGSAWYFFLRSSTASDVLVAVLPFEPIQAGITGESFAREIHEGMYQHLLNTHGLRLPDQDSAVKFLGSEKSSSEIGRELDVEYLLAGDFQIVGNAITFNIQLLEAKTDLIAWSESFHRLVGSENLPFVVREISDQLLPALSLVLPEFKDVNVKIPLSYHPQALEDFRAARAILRKDLKTEIPDAINLLKSATTRDPNFAEAYATLSQAYHQYQKVKPEGLPAEAARLAMKDAVSKALDIKKNDSTVQASLGMLRLSEGNMLGARDAFNQALDLDASNARAYSGLAQVEFSRGLPRNSPEYDSFIQRVISLREKAIENDPSDPGFQYELGFTYGYLGKIQQGMDVFSQILTKDPEYANAHAGLAKYLEFFRGRFDEALIHLNDALALDPLNIEYYSLIRDCYEALGDTNQALACLEKILSLRTDLSSIYEPDIFLFRGETEKAMKGYLQVWESSENVSVRYRAGQMLFNFDLRNRRFEEARARYFASVLYLFNENPVIENDINAVYAMKLAAVLQGTGESKQAAQLIEASWNFLQNLSSTDPARIFNEIIMYILEGEVQTALRLLSAASESGLTVSLDLNDARLDPLRNEPVFMDVLDKVEREKTAQRNRVADLITTGMLPVLSGLMSP